MSQSQPQQTGVCFMSLLWKWAASSKGHASGLWLVDFDLSCLSSMSQDACQKITAIHVPGVFRQNFQNFWFEIPNIFCVKKKLLSIYDMRDRIILKFEARVQIYVAVLNICCEIQNSGRNIARFSKINSCEISFWLVLYKNMRNMRFLGVWCHYFAVNSWISEIFSEKSSTFHWNVENYKLRGIGMFVSVSQSQVTCDID